MTDFCSYNVLTNNWSDYNHEVEYVPDFFKVMMPQSSKLESGFEDKDQGEKPVKDLYLPDTRPRLLLRKHLNME